MLASSLQSSGQVRAQRVAIDATGAQNDGRIAVIGEAEQQVFEGCIFVPAVAGPFQGSVQRVFEISGQHLIEASSRLPTD